MTNNRRQPIDRRLNEAGPPSGWGDRRRHVERRLPEVVEITFREWITCYAQRDDFRGVPTATDPDQ